MNLLNPNTPNARFYSSSIIWQLWHFQFSLHTRWKLWGPGSPLGACHHGTGTTRKCITHCPPGSVTLSPGLLSGWAFRWVWPVAKHYLWRRLKVKYGIYPLLELQDMNFRAITALECWHKIKAGHLVIIQCWMRLTFFVNDSAFEANFENQSWSN